MPEIEKVITVAGEWVKKAEDDLKNATFTLEMDDECPTDTVCFHAQQVVEKYLKALLVFKGIPFPKTHNIEDIIALLPPGSRPKLTEKDQDKLTEYATVTGTLATRNRSPSTRRRRMFFLLAGREGR